MQLLIIGTLDGQVGAASQMAMARGAKVTHVETVSSGLDVLRAGPGADLVMVDVKFDIKSLIDSLVSERINVPVIACGINTDAGAAVRAIRAGAKEYIPLPPDADLIAAVIAAVTEESHTIVYRDPAMSQVVRMAEQVAPSDASILVTGESGTGKELIARLVHRKSRRAAKRFIAINCAAIPENLLESELFGHEKGAFTGAVARRLGRFEEANGGTLLLDEISEMDIRLQAKLLRALQEKEIDRIGGNVPVKVDVRIIATSNRSMEEEVRRGAFREDLYYRLNVVNLRLPSLRERPLDIELLANHFLKKYAELNGIPPRPLSEPAKRMLLAHSWRGNVRELENAMHRAVLLATGNDIGSEAILLTGGLPSNDPTANVVASAAAAAAAVGNTKSLVGRTVSDVERDLIIDTLQHCLGNRTHAANILGISIRTLRNKLRLYTDEGIPVPPPGEPDHSAA
ncbi:sigma-54 dependent transcriptional regulator [Telmatospirillum sp.]|uniref:sigma-54-dependent transcriptional regulator FlbD n=1 Tax=Telmatospirillum sp. TaxID=2079197 RepID=UPI0028473379|nr:sigma-54 dependent transcriptional regulator [Telmatospirillum sp.]MDR3440778.1 sigma-54 dependent transcriptional regulator [Telmatospirillum sp.]